jgi:hypothetical protein
MLDLRDRKNWKNKEGFYNIFFITGFVQNIVKTRNELSFCIQQSLKKEYYRVIITKRKYYSFDFKNGDPIKVIARMKQDPILDYPSIVLYPLKIARPEVTEISATHFNELLNLSLEEINSRNKDLVNFANIAGYIYAKKILNEHSMMLLLWCSEYNLIPIFVLGKQIVQDYHNLKQFTGIRIINGKIMLTNINGVPQVVIITKKLKIAINDNDIPKIELKWLIKAKLKSC